MFCSGRSFSLGACAQRVKCKQCWAWEARRPSAVVYQRWPGMLSDQYSFSAQKRKVQPSVISYQYCITPAGKLTSKHHFTAVAGIYRATVGYYRQFSKSCWMCTSGLRLKAFAGFPTQRRSKIISFMAKSSLSCQGKKEEKCVQRDVMSVSVCHSEWQEKWFLWFLCSPQEHIIAFTCAINWMILTKILRGMSLGTTLRDPLGKSVVIMVLRRLRTQRRDHVMRKPLTSI